MGKDPKRNIEVSGSLFAPEPEPEPVADGRGGRAKKDGPPQRRGRDGQRTTAPAAPTAENPTAKAAAPVEEPAPPQPSRHSKPPKSLATLASKQQNAQALAAVAKAISSNPPRHNRVEIRTPQDEEAAPETQAQTPDAKRKSEPPAPPTDLAAELKRKAEIDVSYEQHREKMRRKQEASAEAEAPKPLPPPVPPPVPTMELPESHPTINMEDVNNLVETGLALASPEPKLTIPSPPPVVEEPPHVPEDSAASQMQTILGLLADLAKSVKKLEVKQSDDKEVSRTLFDGLSRKLAGEIGDKIRSAVPTPAPAAAPNTEVAELIKGLITALKMHGEILAKHDPKKAAIHLATVNETLRGVLHRLNTIQGDIADAEVKVSESTEQLMTATGQLGEIASRTKDANDKLDELQKASSTVDLTPVLEAVNALSKTALTADNLQELLEQINAAQAQGRNLTDEQLKKLVEEHLKQIDAKVNPAIKALAASGQMLQASHEAFTNRGDAMDRAVGVLREAATAQRSMKPPIILNVSGPNPGQPEVVEALPTPTAEPMPIRKAPKTKPHALIKRNKAERDQIVGGVAVIVAIVIALSYFLKGLSYWFELIFSSSLAPHGVRLEDVHHHKPKTKGREMTMPPVNPPPFDNSGDVNDNGPPTNPRAGDRRSSGPWRLLLIAGGILGLTGLVAASRSCSMPNWRAYVVAPPPVSSASAVASAPAPKPPRMDRKRGYTMATGACPNLTQETLDGSLFAGLSHLACEEGENCPPPTADERNIRDYVIPEDGSPAEKNFNALVSCTGFARQTVACPEGRLGLCTQDQVLDLCPITGARRMDLTRAKQLVPGCHATED